MVKTSIRVIIISLFSLLFLSQTAFAGGNDTYVATDKLPLYRSLDELKDYRKHLTIYNSSYTRFAVLYFGDKVTILEEDQYAAKVRTTDGKEGWVQKDYLSQNPTSHDWLIKDERVLRSEPYVTASAIGSVPSKSKVKVLDCKYIKTEQYKDWYKVQTSNGTVGWIWGAIYIDNDWVNRGYNVIRYEFEKSGIVTNDLSVFSPLYSFANVTAGELNSFISSKTSGSSTQMNGMGSAFLEAQTVTGLNAIYLMAHAGHETGWGKSSIVNNKYNFYGIGAIDSKPAQGAYTFNNQKDGIVAGAIWIGDNYIIRSWDTDRNYPFYQSTLDNMKNDNGGWHQYATDEAWAVKIGNFVKQFYAYTYPNGFVMKKGWYKEGSDYYYFDTNGKMVTGWLPWSGQWYFMKKNGYMAREWQYDKGNWYYMNNSGAMETGWIFDKNKWYYLDSSGAMLSNRWFYHGGNWYYMSNSGAMNTGWIKVDGEWYYHDQNGYMETGWIFDENKWYYLDSSGAMLSNQWFYHGGNWYYMSNSGAMNTGWIKVDGEWYYHDHNGYMQTGWLKDKDVWYYMNKDGVMLTGWVKDNGIWYYMNKDGAMQTGWVLDNGIWYYMNKDGAMQRGWQLIDKKWYYFHYAGDMAFNTTVNGYRLASDGSWIQ